MTVNRTGLSLRKMREQFYAWHGGMYSALYAAASSGLVADLESLQAELNRNADWLIGVKGAGNSPIAKVTYASMQEAAYLRKVAKKLPMLLSLRFTASDGKLYRALPWSTEKPTFVDMVIRRDRKTGEVGLFFWNGIKGKPASGELECYFHNGQHGRGDWAYMVDQCRPAYLSEPDAAALVREWEEMGPTGVYARPLSRLPRFKG